MQPLVTVLIPVFNREAFLADAIESAIAQEHQPVEIVVVDDGSTDSSAEIAAGFEQVRLLRQKRGGPAAARNTGVEAARGKLIAMLDSDDMMAPGRLALQVSHLATHPEAVAVLGRQRLLVENGAPLPNWLNDPRSQLDLDSLDRVARGADPIYVAGTLTVRRSAYEQVGLYNTDFFLGEDGDWLLRAWEEGLRIDTIDEVAVIRRIHDTNMTQDAPGMRRAMAKVLKARIDRQRRRAAGGPPRQ